DQRRRAAHPPAQSLTIGGHRPANAFHPVALVSSANTDISASADSTSTAGRAMTEQHTPIELYSSSTPNGRKITIMLEELGVPYHLNYIRLSRGEQFRPEFLAISPNNKIPAIVD